MENTLAIAQLMRGERPEDMSYSDFKIKRKIIQTYLKNKLKGTVFYVSKEFVEEVDPTTGVKYKTIKTYKPYKKKES